ncbi:MAG: hypothetical protein ABW075_09565 [Aeromicrobium sp.]
MSDSNGPVRRRRIAGESGPAAPVAPAPAKRIFPKKAAAKKAATTTRTAPAVKAAPPVKRAAPVTPPVTRVPTRKPAPTSEPARKAVPAPTSEPVTTGRTAGSRPSRRDVLWLVPATLVAVAALVVGAFMMISPPGSDDSGEALDASRRQASAAAASAAETIFTFRYDQLDEHLTASKALMTPAFAKEFDTIAPALTELAPQRQIVVQAVTRESAAMACGAECSASKAEVLVFVDQARLVGDSQEPTVFANRIKVSMVKGDDGWVVADIRAL